MTWLSPEVFIAAANFGVAIVVLLRMAKLEKNTNSKMDELLQLKGESSEAIGNLQGRKELTLENEVDSASTTRKKP